MVLNPFRRSKAPGPWTRPSTFDRNLVIVGGGTAGLVSASIAAAARARVTLVEAHRMGGDCLNTGCVPSKALIRSATLAHQMRQGHLFGLETRPPRIDFAAVMERVHRVIAEIAPHDSAERFEGLGVEVLKGHATLADPWTVEVALAGGGTRRLTARAILVATGAAPVVPEIPGIEEAGFLTSETLWDRLRGREEAPRRLLVLGGGPIGTELSQAFARLGSSVTQVEKGPRLLPREDEEVSVLVQDSLEADGVRVLTGHEALACGTTGGERWVEVGSEGGRQRIAFDEMIVALGRRARLHGLGLERLGIPADGVIGTNAYLQTTHPHILAAGDVAGRYQFTHAAERQAWTATLNALFGDVRRSRFDDRVIPWAIFVDPEVARVGLNEQEAREKGIPREVTRYALDGLDRAVTDGATRGFVKVLTSPGRDRILGATIVGERAGDLMAEIVLAMQQGLGLGRILGTVHIYPTFAEANRNAARDWRRRHLNPRLMALAGRFHDWRRG